ncbi:uncharacterized protein CC84DRAFT_1226688 [Paraphaeosphaeria sporulosa]|uniref:beta-glucosidase n=1 Tax=Paraphaeosphaeria sporulosa TaxID=1460663 RepID=A0A177CY19_9PLEO|nr:uncharacterized protein CC84DRAFT_1226688 [Paraphaeosphaeria sporulosa]OAG12433.1 hypothetical protein CC84DRAFT_1226688 [Paraphaeosphaeria sporulosa]
MQNRSKLSIGEPMPYPRLSPPKKPTPKIMPSLKLLALRARAMSVSYAPAAMRTNQTRLVHAVAAASNKTILVLYTGNPIDVSEVIDEFDAVLLARFPRQEGDNAAADVLTGRVSPNGRLATTWFKTLEDVPSFKHFPPQRQGDGKVTVEYEEGVRVDY